MMKNIKQEMIDKLVDKSKEDILIKLKNNFISSDAQEPFQDRGYVEDTIAVFDMLISGNEDDSLLIRGSALCDVISDIFRYFTGDIE